MGDRKIDDKHYLMVNIAELPWICPIENLYLNYSELTWFRQKDKKLSYTTPCKNIQVLHNKVKESWWSIQRQKINASASKQLFL